MGNGMFCTLAVIAIVFLTGCQQPAQEAPSQQQARLLAAQNADLQKQLAARQAEIKVLHEKYTKELRLRDQELIRCKVRIDALQQEVKKGINQRVGTITARVLDENAKLRQEIEQLKAEIERLKAAPAKEDK
ncbi:MAG: Atg14 domain-containing protein [Planctomycetes bacterium]|nr:Atg14 domain-containing protein [Planctomycetota bacterium]